MSFIPFFKPSIGEEELKAIKEVLEKGWLTTGERTQELEKKFEKHLQKGYAIFLSSATSALHIGLRLLPLKPGDEVLLPAFTFVSCIEALLYLSLKPVLVDIDPKTHLISLEDIERKITPKSRALLIVHYAGLPCNMKEIQEICKKYKLFLIEDCAHSLPAYYKNKHTGTFGEIAYFSFYATKPITTGEGGMLVVKNKKQKKRAQILRQHGIKRKKFSWDYDVVEIGYKYNATDFQAAIGIIQMKKMFSLWKKREEIAKKYTFLLKDSPYFIPYPSLPDRKSSWHLYPLKLRIEKLRISRNTFLKLLYQEGIQGSMHFIPLYRFRAYRFLGYSPKDFPHTEWVYKRSLSLPLYPDMSPKEVEKVIEKLFFLAKKYKR